MKIGNVVEELDVELHELGATDAVEPQECAPAPAREPEPVA